MNIRLFSLCMFLLSFSAFSNDLMILCHYDNSKNEPEGAFLSAFTFKNTAFLVVDGKFRKNVFLNGYVASTSWYDITRQSEDSISYYGKNTGGYSTFGHILIVQHDNGTYKLVEDSMTLLQDDSFSYNSFSNRVYNDPLVGKSEHLCLKEPYDVDVLNKFFNGN